MAPRPTIVDVAREAGVSRGAVSFALNDRPGVADATRARILAVAAEPRVHAQPPGARAVLVAGTDGRTGDRPTAGDAQRRPVLPRLHRRDRDDPGRARPGPAPAGGARPGVRAPQLRDPLRQQSRRRRLPHGSACRRPPAGSARVARSADGGDRPQTGRVPLARRRGRRPARHRGRCRSPGGPGSPADRARRGPDGVRPLPLPPGRVGRHHCGGGTRGVAPGLGRLLAVRRGSRHPTAPGPSRAAHRHRLRQRPDGDRRHVRGPGPWSARA